MDNSITFTGGVLEMVLQNPSALFYMYQDVFAPFAGKSITADIKATDTNAGAELTSGDVTCKIDALDANGDVISTIDTGIYKPSEPTQNINLNGIIPANTVDIRFYLVNATAYFTEANNISLSQPTLKIT